MKILHCCLSCFYIDNYNYQENMLVREHVKLGHNVSVLASTETYDSAGLLTYKDAGNYMGSDGALVTRVPYKKYLPHKIMTKIRSYKGVYKFLKKEKPDIILFHGLCAYELLTLIRYKKNNPSVKLFLDSHEDFNNSAQNILSKYILHYAFYRRIFLKALPFIEKVLCISSETINFVRDFYSCSEKFIEYFPLGGVIPSDDEYLKKRNQTRKQYNLDENTLIFLQTGKFDKKKKLKESILAFNQISHFSRIKFLIAGVFLEEEAEILELISQDTRIKYLGWKSAADLYDLLCAIDIYLQPGSQSATLQNSICCRCAVIVDDVISHKPFVKNNGWLLNESSSLSEVLAQAMQKFEKNTLQIMKDESLKIAYDLLDYSKQAQRLLK